MSALLLALAASPALLVADPQPISLTLLATGASRKLGYYTPQKTTLSEARPDTLKTLPPDLKAPLFATFTIAGRDGATYHAVLDEPEGQDARLFIDTNGDGDLTNDPHAQWTGREAGKTEDGKPLTMYSGSGRLNLGTADNPREIGINLYRFARNDPKRAAYQFTLLYYRDYAAEGEMTLGQRTLKITLVDDATTGDFRGEDPGDDERASSGVKLLIDVNGDGAYARRGEQFDARRPFNIGGTTYQLADIAADGTSFKLARSEKTVPEIALAPEHGVGKTITAFDAKLMDGRDLRFPADYKGKIVMIDFWATWCGPCMAEVPNLVEVYKKYHDQGFEILGISLDRPKTEAKIASVTGDKGMTWPQVYDGGFWKARIADLYAIDSIPAAFLVDGDTGKILAVTASLRGDRLDKTIADALRARRPE